MKTIFVFLISFCLAVISCNRVEEIYHSIQTESNIEFLIQKGDEYYQKGEYNKAKLIFDKMVLIDSTYGQAYYRRAYCNAQSSDFVNSTHDYLKSISLNYRVEDSNFSIGCNYAALFNDTLALKYFSIASKLNPKNLAALNEVIHFKKRLDIVDI